MKGYGKGNPRSYTGANPNPASLPSAAISCSLQETGPTLPNNTQCCFQGLFHPSFLTFSLFLELLCMRSEGALSQTLKLRLNLLSHLLANKCKTVNLEIVWLREIFLVMAKALHCCRNGIKHDPWRPTQHLAVG